MLSFTVSPDHGVSYVVDPFFNENKAVREWDFVKVPVPSGEHYRSVQLLQLLLTECEIGSTYDLSGASWLFGVRYAASLGMWSGGLGWLIGLLGDKFPAPSSRGDGDVEQGGVLVVQPGHPRSFFCSELAMESLKFVGFFEGYRSQLCTPQSLYNLVSKSKWKLQTDVGRDPSKSSSVLVRIAASSGPGPGGARGNDGSRSRSTRRAASAQPRTGGRREIPLDMQRGGMY